MFKPILISFASKGREDYLKMAENLYLSVKEHWKFDYVFYTMGSDRTEFEGMKITPITEIPETKLFKGKPHSEIPYQFKFALIQKAREEGYSHVIWCDSSIVLEKCPLHLLEHSNKGVMSFHNLGHETKDYIGDKAVEILQSDLHEISSAPQIWGGCIGFDFCNPIASEIFDIIVSVSQLGAFNDCGSSRDGFKAHRHDQAVMSVLFYRYGILPYNYGHIVCANPHKANKEYGDYYTFSYGK